MRVFLFLSIAELCEQSLCCINIHSIPQACPTGQFVGGAANQSTERFFKKFFCWNVSIFYLQLYPWFPQNVSYQVGILKLIYL